MNVCVNKCETCRDLEQCLLIRLRHGCLSRLEKATMIAKLYCRLKDTYGPRQAMPIMRHLGIVRTERN